jgi:hypothetical protein
MTSLHPQNDFKQIEIYASSLVDTWLNLMMEKQYQEAENICIDFIKKYGSLFGKRAFKIKEDEYNRLLVLLVLVRGLQEYIHLCKTTKSISWHEDNSTIENVWIKLCDCRERLEFVSHYYQGEVIERVTHDINGLENFFRDTFGDGLYCSPGIILDGCLCNICNQDFRACSHIAGRLYNGQICSYKPINPQIDHVAIVEIPKDLRCRIWEWYIKDNKDKETGITIENLCVLTTFSVNDFLQEFEA